MESHTGLTGADYAVIAVYIIGIVLLGTYAGRRQKNTEDFLLAGRSMRWWPIAISLFAALSRFPEKRSITEPPCIYICSS